MRNTMSNKLDEVQPVDTYVKSLLMHAKETGKVSVDVQKPTRGQRLEAALFFDQQGDEWSGIEIMMGKRIDAQDRVAQTANFMMLEKAMFGGDPRRFYGGFAHCYWPQE